MSLMVFSVPAQGNRATRCLHALPLCLAMLFVTAAARPCFSGCAHSVLSPRLTIAALPELFAAGYSPDRIDAQQQEWITRSQQIDKVLRRFLLPTGFTEWARETHYRYVSGERQRVEDIIGVARELFDYLASQPQFRDYFLGDHAIIPSADEVVSNFYALLEAKAGSLMELIQRPDGGRALRDIVSNKVAGGQIFLNRNDPSQVHRAYQFYALLVALETQYLQSTQGEAAMVSAPNSVSPRWRHPGTALVLQAI